jgi:hypothetical protein
VEEFLLPKAAENTNTDTDADTALVAGERSTNSDLVFSKLNLTRTFFLIVVMLIVFTLSYDSFVASSQKYQRVVGQNFVTLRFLLQ